MALEGSYNALILSNTYISMTRQLLGSMELLHLQIIQYSHCTHRRHSGRVAIYFRGRYVISNEHERKLCIFKCLPPYTILGSFEAVVPSLQV
jgi:hypothetical protein